MTVTAHSYLSSWLWHHLPCHSTSAHIIWCLDCLALVQVPECSWTSLCWWFAGFAWTNRWRPGAGFRYQQFHASPETPPGHRGLQGCWERQRVRLKVPLQTHVTTCKMLCINMICPHKEYSINYCKRILKLSHCSPFSRGMWKETHSDRLDILYINLYIESEEGRRHTYKWKHCCRVREPSVGHVL